MENNKILKIQNLIKQQYLDDSNNYLVCIDTTRLGLYGELFIAMDVGTRCIIGHCYSEDGGITTDQVCETLKTIAHHRSFLPKIQIVHSDRAQLFKTKKYYECLNDLGIPASRGAAFGHTNQVIERLFSTLKEMLKMRLDKDWIQKKQDPLNCVGHKEMEKLVLYVVETYNCRPHSTLKGLSPNEMEEAFFEKHRKDHPPKENLLATKKTSEGVELETYYKNNWLPQLGEYTPKKLIFLQEKEEIKIPQGAVVLEQKNGDYKELPAKMGEIAEYKERVVTY